MTESDPMAPGRRRRRARRRRVRSVEVDGRSLALSRCGGAARRAGEPLPAPGRPARRGVDREGPAALPVARLRLRPDHRAAAGRVQRRGAELSRSRSARTACTSSCPTPAPPVRTVADTLVETLVAFGITHVFGMVGHSNLGFADALRRAEERGEITYIGIRHEGAAAFAASAYGKLTGRPAMCFAIAGPGLDEPADRAVRREAGRLAGRRGVRPGAVVGARPRRVPGPRPVQRVRRRRGVARRSCWPAATTPNSPRSRSSGRSTAAASRTSCCPTRCRCCQSSSRRPRPAGRFTARRILPDADVAGPGRGAGPRRPAAGVHRRPRRARRRREQVQALAERLGAPGADDVQGQGPDPGHPPARRRRARPQRHAGRELADERVRPARRRRRLASPTTPASPPTSRSCRSTTRTPRSAASTRSPSTCSATPR